MSSRDTPGGDLYFLGPGRVEMPFVTLPLVSWVPDKARDRAERPPRDLRVSAGRVTFPPDRGLGQLIEQEPAPQSSVAANRSAIAASRPVSGAA
jgi:hypothetical protein